MVHYKKLKLKRNSSPLTLARTCYLSILERTWGGGGCNPHAISSLIEIELWDKDQTISWNVLSPMVPELTSLDHILTPPGRVKEKKDSDFKIYSFSLITLKLRKRTK